MAVIDGPTTARLPRSSAPFLEFPPRAKCPLFADRRNEAAPRRGPPSFRLPAVPGGCSGQKRVARDNPHPTTFWFRCLPKAGSGRCSRRNPIRGKHSCCRRFNHRHSQVAAKPQANPEGPDDTRRRFASAACAFGASCQNSPARRPHGVRSSLH